jgi:hypothetical protein
MRAGAKAGERPARWWQSQESVNLTIHLSPERHKRARERVGRPGDGPPFLVPIQRVVDRQANRAPRARVVVGSLVNVVDRTNTPSSVRTEKASR